jgi:hypothetical protein
MLLNIVLSFWCWVCEKGLRSLIKDSSFALLNDAMSTACKFACQLCRMKSIIVSILYLLSLKLNMRAG